MDDGSGIDAADSLVMPAVNCQSYTGIVLVFDHVFRNWGTDRGYLEISTDGGLNWGSLVTYDYDIDPPGQKVVLDISAQAAGHSDVRIRFHFNDEGDWGWYWMVDSVYLFGN